ncbi:MAG: DUF2442 domain-containing protein [Bacteroidales bacterium]|nr:DUF2442 domain-containing protein [Bacteroidales bacterium]
MENNIKITDIWFDEGRIFMRDASNAVYSRPLEAFPLLMDATEEQRLAYDIDPQGDAVRWPEIDEDIHVSSFLEQQEPNKDNEIARIFRRFPQLNVSEVARQMGINKSLLSKYIYGIKTPSEHRRMEIKHALHTLGEELIAV